MTIERLREAVSRRPFRPFWISLADGRRFLVRSPEFLWIPPRAERTFGISGTGGDEDYSILDLLLVTSLDYRRPARNGRRRRE